MLDLTDLTPCLASTNPPCLFNFYGDEDAAHADLARANRCILAPKDGYQVMRYGQYKAAERAFYLDDPLTTIDERHYTEMFEVLPPLHCQSHRSFHSFLMSEFHAGVYTRQYACSLGHYVCRMVDATDTSTWITA